MLAPVLAQDGDHRGELAGPVDDVEPQLRQPALARELTGQHAGQQPGVDIAAAQHETELAALEAPASASTAARPAAPAPSVTVFSMVMQEAQRVLDLLFGDQHDVVDQRAHDLGGDAAGRLDRDAFRERVAAHRKLLPLDEVVHRRIERGLHADDLDIGLERLGGDRHAGDQAAAADRHRSERRGRAPQRASRARWCPDRR